MQFACVYILVVVYCCSSKSTNNGDNVLCDSTDYAQDIYRKLTSNLYFSDRYSIHQGSLIWVQNDTSQIGSDNPSGIYGTYKILPFGEYETENGILLRSSDALLFAGCTPPKSRYYSWTEDLCYRYYNVTRASKLFAPLGDSLNNLLINTSNKTNPFNALTTIITTGDQQTFDDINYILNSSTGDNNEINLRPIPNKWFNFLPYGVRWYESKISFDTFIPILRITIPEDGSLYKQYILINQTVFYIQFQNASNGTNQPRIPLLNETRNTYSVNNVNETEIYQQELIHFQKDLVQNLTEQYKLTFVKKHQFKNKFGNEDYGFWCIENNHDCNGDTRDAQYWLYTMKNISNQQIYLVIGVNSFNVNLTTYQNFALTKLSNALTNFDYNGSAINLNINTTVSDQVLSNFYVIQYGTTPFVLDGIPAIQIDPKIYGNSIDFVGRDYLNPITKTRPDNQEMIAPLMLIFSVD